MSKLRAGIIGLGVGERHIPGYRADPRCEVVAICDSDRAKLAEVAGRNPGLRLTGKAMDILKDPSIDVVSIASYDNDHCEQVLAAIAAGKHIFVEKPLCLLDAEFDAIAAALAANPQIRLSSNLILRRTHRVSSNCAAASGRARWVRPIIWKAIMTMAECTRSAPAGAPPSPFIRWCMAGRST